MSCFRTSFIIYFKTITQNTDNCMNYLKVTCQTLMLQEEGIVKKHKNVRDNGRICKKKNKNRIGS